jgi:hypothetical protein
VRNTRPHGARAGQPGGSFGEIARPVVTCHRPKVPLLGP